MTARQLMHNGHPYKNIAILLIAARENKEYFLSERGYKFVQEGLEILKQYAPFEYETVTEIFSGGNNEEIHFRNHG